LEFILCHWLYFNETYDAVDAETETRLRRIKQESRAVAGNPRDAAVIFDP